MDAIIRAYTRLGALKQNLPKGIDVHEKYIQEYNEIVDLLSKSIHATLGEFIITERELEHRVTSYTPSDPLFAIEGGTTYSKDRYCERALLLSKLDALLSYFQIKYLLKEKPEVGFKTAGNG